MRAVRSLSGRSMRSRQGRYLVEGPQPVREAVTWVPGDIVDLYVTARAAERYPEITRTALDHEVRVHGASDEVLAAMSPDAQGVVAVARDRAVDLGALPDGLALVAVLARVRDPGNAGTVIRAADAAGADAAVLTGESVELRNPKVVRSTAGSLFHLPVVGRVRLEESLEALRAAGCQVLAADGSGEFDLDDLLDVAGTAPDGMPDLTSPTAWLFGNEAQGLDPAELALADASVRVPLRGRAESLNLATAATVCLYASSRAQRAR